MTQNTVTMVAPQNSLMAVEEAPVADGFQPLSLAGQEAVASFPWFAMALGVAMVLATIVAYLGYLWFKKDRSHGAEINFTRSIFH